MNTQHPNLESIFGNRAIAGPAIPIGQGTKFILPEDGFYHFAPKGEFPIVWEGDGKTYIQVFDAAAHDAIIAAFNRAAQSPTFAGLLMDDEHFSYDPDKTTDALGWGMEMQKREDGLWVKPKLSDIGSVAVMNGRKRFLSPTILPKDFERLDGNRIRPLRVDSIAFTNKPNITTLKPISNRDTDVLAPFKNGDVAGHDFHGNQYVEGESATAFDPSNKANAYSRSVAEKGGYQEHSQAGMMHGHAETSHRHAAEKARGAGKYDLAAMHEHQADQHKLISDAHFKMAGRKMGEANQAATPLSNRQAAGAASAETQTSPVTKGPAMKSVALALGLSADASEEAVLAAVTKLQTDTTSFKNRVSVLEQENTTMAGSVVDADLLKYSKRFKPEAKDAWRKALLANRADALALLEGLPEQTTPKPMHNRESAKTPNGDVEGEDPNQDKGADLNAHPFMNRVREVAKERNVSETQAIDIVARGDRQLYSEYCRAAAPRK